MTRRTAAALVKLVVFAVVTLVATGLLAMTIGNLRFGATRTYAALLTDATGLAKGDDVRIAGVRVGEVERVAVSGDRLARVTFTVDADQRLTSTTRLVVRYRNLIGQRYVALTEGAGGGSRMRPGATIPLERTTPALDLTVLFNGFKPLFAALSPRDVNTLSLELVRTLQGEGGTVTSLLARTASLTSMLADRDEVIGRTIDNLDTVLSTVDERDRQLSALLSELQRFVSGLSDDRAAIGASLDNISALASTTAGLVRDARPAVRTDIRELGKVAETLDDNEQLVSELLTRLPSKLDTITRTATYGSWFNFYLCDFEGRIVLPTGVTYTPNYHVQTARCS